MCCRMHSFMLTCKGPRISSIMSWRVASGNVPREPNSSKASFQHKMYHPLPPDRAWKRGCNNPLGTRKVLAIFFGSPGISDPASTEAAERRRRKSKGKVSTRRLSNIRDSLPEGSRCPVKEHFRMGDESMRAFKRLLRTCSVGV